MSLISLLVAACGGGSGGGGGGGTTPVDVGPTVLVVGPADDVEVGEGSTTVVTVRYVDDDPDSVAVTDLIADRDGDLATTGDQVLIAEGRPEQDGTEQSVPWSLSGVPAGTYRVMARTSDASTSAVGSATGFVLINAAPILSMTSPSTNVTVSRGARVTISYSDSDLDDAALTWLFADRDGQLATPHDTHVIAMARPELNGLSQTIAWDTTGVPFGTYRIMAMTWDGTNPPATRSATGRVTVDNVSFASGGGGLDFDSALSVAAFADGSTVVVGYFTDEATFGPGELNETTLTGAGALDLFVARYFPNGALEWARRAGGIGNDFAYGVVALADGGSVLTGSFDGSATFGPGDASQTILTSVGGTDLFLAKLNADGTLAWVKQAGDALSFAYGVGIDLAPDGTFLVTGTYSGDVTFGRGEGAQTTLAWEGDLDAFVARYTATGNLVWARRISGLDAAEGNAVSSFPDGSCVVTGYFTGATTFAPGAPNATTLTAFGAQEVFLARYASNGDLLWATQAGGFLGTASGVDVSTFSDGTCVVAGWFTEFMDFGFGEPNETNFLAPGSGDGFVARFQANGQVAWAVQHTSAFSAVALAIEARDDGSCVVGGSFEGAAVLGWGEPNEMTIYADNLVDMYLAALNADGSLKWARSEGGTSSFVYAQAMTLYADGSVGVAGSLDDGHVLFGEGDNMAWPVFSQGLDDMFVARYNADGGF